MLLRTLVQIGLVLLCWLAGLALVHLTGLPVSASVAGFAVLLLLLGTGLLRLSWIKQGADCLLARMLVFFVPAVLAVIEHPEFLGAPGLRILAVIVLGTLAVMGTTVAVAMLAGRMCRPRGEGA